MAHLVNDGVDVVALANEGSQRPVPSLSMGVADLDALDKGKVVHGLPMRLAEQVHRNEGASAPLHPHCPYSAGPDW